MLVQIAVSIVVTLQGFIGNEIQVINTDQAQQTTLSPQEYLKELAGPDFELLNRIVICESGWKPAAQNASSSAGGLFQFLDSTWNRYSSSSWEKYNPYDNIKAGVALYNKEGVSPWNESRNCWKDLL